MAAGTTPAASGMPPFDAESGVKFVISLRAERPVERCELSPHAFLQIKGGSMDNATRAKMMDANPHTFVFTWRKSPRKAMCENLRCSRRESYEPGLWCKLSLSGPMLQCAVCEKAGLPRYESTFCCKSCFVSAWKSHCEHRHSGLPAVVSRAQSQPTTASVEDCSASALARRAASFDNAADAGVVPSSYESQDWPVVCTDKSFTASAADVGCILRVEVRAVAVNGGQVLAGPVTVFTETILACPKPPPKRSLLTVGGSTPLTSSAGGGAGARFRVISYNILSEVYATKQAYPYCEPWVLAWPYRLALLMQELDEAQGDIVCLQEVQADHYEQHLFPYMQERGFDSVYKQKTRESMGQYGKVDGCATFWRRSKFMMLENFTVEFNESARRTATDMNLDESDGRRYMNKLLRDNVAQVLLLEVISRSAVRLPRQSMQLCVVNTHLYSNHLRPDVKLWQALTLMKQVEQFALSRDVAVMICGDLNSEPSSAVYEFLFDGTVNYSRPELNPGENSISVLPELHNVNHSLDLESAMSVALGEEPEFTNFTAKFRGVLDYVCFTPSRLRVMAVAQVPDAAELEAVVGPGLPCVNFPSDHVMLCCDVAFVITGSGGLTRQPKRKSLMQLQQQQMGMGRSSGKAGSSGRLMGVGY